MTQTIANRMTTAPDPVFVACSPLQPQEEMLAGDRMAEVHGGAILPVLIVAARVAAPYVARVAVPALSAAVPALSAAAGAIIAYDWTSEESGDGTTVNVNVNNCNCDSDCCN